MELIQKLKSSVIKASNDPKFIHHKWYVAYHLEIVEKISLELCEIYTDADRELVLAIVWLHDYPKILNLKDIHDGLQKIREQMQATGFPEAFTERVVSYLEIFEQPLTIDLKTAPIEVKITSSADAAAHFVGPFYPLYWYENPQKTIEELLAGNLWKINHDWTKKIVLPEVKKSFQKRYEVMLENTTGVSKNFIE